MPSSKSPRARKKVTGPVPPPVRTIFGFNCSVRPSCAIPCATYWPLQPREEKIKTARQEIVELLKATIEGIDYTWTQREGTIEIIAKWMKLNPVQAAKAYDSVRDTFSKIGVPTEEQAKAYIAMLSSTASLKGDVAAGSIFDFSLAAEAAKELAQKK